MIRFYADLYDSDLQQEQDNAKSSLLALIRIEAKSAMHQLLKTCTSQDAKQRERSVAFLKEAVNKLKGELTEETKKHVCGFIKGNLNTSTINEFFILLRLLFVLEQFKGANVKEALDLMPQMVKIGQNFKVRSQRKQMMINSRLMKETSTALFSVLSLCGYAEHVLLMFSCLKQNIIHNELFLGQRK